MSDVEAARRLVLDTAYEGGDREPDLAEFESAVRADERSPREALLREWLDVGTEQMEFMREQGLDCDSELMCQHPVDPPCLYSALADAVARTQALLRSAP